MLYSKFMVMSFPFVAVVERNEKKKKLGVVNNEKFVRDEQSQKCPKPEPKNQSQDMVFLSNLEEIVFSTSPSRCLMDEMRVTPRPPIDYDKYLDFFE